MSDAPRISGVSHVALTVRDLARSADWYERVLGLERVEDVTLEGHDLAVLLHRPTDLAINLHQHHDNAGEPFRESRTGLDHLSLLVSSRAELERIAGRLEDLGVAHSPIADDYYGSVLVVRDPDGIQLEFFANPPGQGP